MAALGHGPVSSAPVSAQASTAATVGEDFILGIEDGSNDVAVFAASDAQNYEAYQGSTQAPLADDVIVEDMPQVSIPELIEDSFTDWSDWSWAQAPPIDDLPEDFILGDGRGLDDQDWTDSGDYGSQTDQLSSDNDQEFNPVSVSEPEQDYTDTADYGDRVDPQADDFPEDQLLGQHEPEQDSTDFADYGSAQEAGVEQDQNLASDGQRATARTKPANSPSKWLFAEDPKERYRQV